VLSSKLSVGIHMMTIFALKPGEPLTSEFIACSVNTNPVVIRRLLGSLRAAGIVESRTGVGGGWSLLVDPERITLLDILRAVEPQDEFFALHRSEPNPECPCGLHIQSVLTEVYDKVQEGMTRQLAGITIACIAGKIRSRVEFNSMRLCRLLLAILSLVLIRERRALRAADSSYCILDQYQPRD